MARLPTKDPVLNPAADSSQSATQPALQAAVVHPPDREQLYQQIAGVDSAMALDLRLRENAMLGFEEVKLNFGPRHPRYMMAQTQYADSQQRVSDDADEFLGKNPRFLLSQSYFPATAPTTLPAKGLNAATRASASTQAATQNSYTLKLSNGVEVQLVGICRDPLHSHLWWAPDGTPLAAPVANLVIDSEEASKILIRDIPDYNAKEEYVFAIRVGGEKEMSGKSVGLTYSFEIEPHPTSLVLPVRNASDRQTLMHDPAVHRFYFPNAPSTVTMNIWAAGYDGTWEHLAAFEGTKRVSGSVAATLEYSPAESGVGVTVLNLKLPGHSDATYFYWLTPRLRPGSKVKPDSVSATPVFLPSNLEAPEGCVYLTGAKMEDISGFDLYRLPKGHGKMSGIHMAPNP